MIDWYNLAANFLWIVGCALALAAISHASWQASLTQQKLRQQLKQAGYQRSLNAAGLLFCLGLAGVSTRWWESILWLLLAATLAFQIVLSFKRSRGR